MSEDRPEEGKVRQDPTEADSEEDSTGSDAGTDQEEVLDTLPPPPSVSAELESLQTLPPAPDEELMEGWERKKLGGRFELLEKVGEGGMGVVFRARDLALDEVVAVKVLQRSLTQSADDIRRFKREIKTARRISHSNVIRIHEFGIEQGEAYICMELLSGGDLASRIADGPLETDEALEIAIAIADGVSAAHAEGIVHRDLKPHNVLFDDKGVVKLLDFGIARFTASKTHTVGIIGTPHYMSPEQSEGLPVSAESDVYSLGILYFELFTGRLPFEGGSLARLAVAHATLEPPRPRDFRPDLPAPIEAVILKALQKKKEDRYADAGELLRALQRVRDGETISVPVVERRRPVRRSLLVALGVVGVFGIGAVAVTINNQLEQSRTQLTPSTTPVATASPKPTPSTLLAAGSPTGTPNKGFSTTGPTVAATPTRVAQPTRTPRPTVPQRTVMPTPTSQWDDVEVEVRISGRPSAWVEIRDRKGRFVAKSSSSAPETYHLKPGRYTATLTKPDGCGGFVPEPVPVKFEVKNGRATQLNGKRLTGIEMCGSGKPGN